MLSVLAKIEVLNFSESIIVSLVGFTIVFFVLIALMFMILVMRAVVGSFEKIGAKSASQDSVTGAPAGATPSGTAPKLVPAKGSVGEIKLNNVDEKTAALVMAIVASEMKAPLNELRFLSIKEKQ
jgi:Na+-transporting methylmalonyl-CoA/oxaloacetate decarboxylase gamma subunit